MSFRNCGFAENQNIKIEENTPSELFLSSKFPPNKQNDQPHQEVINKIADIIVSMHQNCLLKCQNLEIYRDLNSHEQELLIKADKNSSLHTALAGVLAVDSCYKALEKQDKFVTGNVLRANSSLISQFKKMQKETLQNTTVQAHIKQLYDAIKFLTQQIQAFPTCKSRQSEIERQLGSLQLQQTEGQQWGNQSGVLLSELQKENEIIKLALKQKQNHIKSLEGLVERNGQMDRRQERKKSHSILSKLQSQKEFQTESQSSKQPLYDELASLKEELQQKNSIVHKMNEEFASEMEKYNCVFKRLEEQNRQLKKFNDVDTIYLLQELQVEVEGLREQRQKDLMIISDIQRRFQGFSFNRTSRGIETNRGMEPNRGVEPIRGMEHTRSHPYLNGMQGMQGMQAMQESNNYNYYQPRKSYYNERREERRERISSKYYSPNYSSRLSPYERPPPPPTYRDRQQIAYPSTSRMRLTRRDQIRTKSRTRYQNLQSSRQQQQMVPKSTSSINLLERVMAKNH